MDLPKEGVTLTFCVTAETMKFYSYIFTSSPPVSQAVGVTAGIGPTTLVSGRKPNVRSYFHNRLVGTSVPSLAGSLTQKGAPKKTTLWDATLTRAKHFGRVKALDTLATY